jgi:hypothetical protein
LAAFAVYFQKPNQKAQRKDSPRLHLHLYTKQNQNAIFPPGIESVFGTGGFGPLMYSLTPEWWKKTLGWRDGVSIYTLLLSVVCEEGAWRPNLTKPYKVRSERREEVDTA